MKRKHMNHIQDIIRRLQLGESERRIARDMQISRGTVRKYSRIANNKVILRFGLDETWLMRTALLFLQVGFRGCIPSGGQKRWKSVADFQLFTCN
jgi:hypothetical protein